MFYITLTYIRNDIEVCHYFLNNMKNFLVFFENEDILSNYHYRESI